MRILDSKMFEFIFSYLLFINNLDYFSWSWSHPFPIKSKNDSGYCFKKFNQFMHM